MTTRLYWGSKPVCPAASALCELHWERDIRAHHQQLHLIFIHRPEFIFFQIPLHLPPHSTPAYLHPQIKFMRPQTTCMHPHPHPHSHPHPLLFCCTPCSILRAVAPPALFFRPSAPLLYSSQAIVSHHLVPPAHSEPTQQPHTHTPAVPRSHWRPARCWDSQVCTTSPGANPDHCMGGSGSAPGACCRFLFSLFLHRNLC